LAVTAKALKELQKEASEALKKAESEAAKVKDIKAKTQHERTAGVFSAAANVGKKADKVDSIESDLTQVLEQQKYEQRKKEARELDPSIQTEVETYAESSRPAPQNVVQKWKDWHYENNPPDFVDKKGENSVFVDKTAFFVDKGQNPIPDSKTAEKACFFVDKKQVWPKMS